MCLITRFPRIKTNKDIEVYKVLRTDFRSPFQGYRYFLNSLAVSNFKVRPITHWVPAEYAKDVLPKKLIKPHPYLSCFCDFDYDSILVDDISLQIQIIDEGLHSYRDIHNAISLIDKIPEYACIICKAIIPAGSYIYINYNEIVSDKLIIKGRVL